MLYCKNFEPTFAKSYCKFYIQPTNHNHVGFCSIPTNYRCLNDVNDYRKIIPLSYSSTGNFMTCKQLYYLTAIRGIQVKSSQVGKPLKMGSLWDRVLQKYLGGNVSVPDVIDEYEIEPLEVAKVKAIYRAYKYLDVQVEPGGELQAKVDRKIETGLTYGEESKVPLEMEINGFYDRKYPEYFVENKLSGNPQNYLDPFFIQSQVGTYFLGDPALAYCIMEVTRTPDLRLKTSKTKEDESVEEYEERCYQDIISRPSYYFVGWDKEKYTYGKKFHRSEFALDEIKQRYIYIFREIEETRICNTWYKNDKMCKGAFPGYPCDYIPVCRHNTMSETMYQIREKPIF